MPNISPDPTNHHPVPKPLESVSMSVQFTLVHEAHNRQSFQADGHFVPSNCTGSTVHCLNLKTPNGVQILRVMAPSLIDCLDLMNEAILQHVWTSGVADTLRTYTYEQYQLLVQERGQLAQFILDNYSHERSTGYLSRFNTPIHVAVHYLRIERHRLRIRVRDWFLRHMWGHPDTASTSPLPSDSNQWLPDSWRKE